MHSTSQQGDADWAPPLGFWCRSIKLVGELIRSALEGVTGRVRDYSSRPVTDSKPAILPPIPLRAASLCTNEVDACAALYALVLHFDGPERDRQLKRIAWHAEQSMIARMLEIEPHAIDLSAGERISLASLAVRGLSALQPQVRHRFTANIRSLITADDSVSLFECIVLLLIESSAPLESGEFEQRVTEPTEVGEQLVALLMALITTYDLTRNNELRSLNNALSRIGLPLRTSFPSRTTFERLSWAMRGLRRSSPYLIELILNGCEVAMSEATSLSGKKNTHAAELLAGLRLCIEQSGSTSSLVC